MATRVVKAEPFHTPEQEPYVQVGSNAWPVKNRGFRRLLTHHFYTDTGTVPSEQALHDALGVLEGRALYDGPEHRVFVRVAAQGGSIYLDLANAKREVVGITPVGWRLLTHPPVRFWRPDGLLPLFTPAPGGSIADWRPFVNVASEDEVKLVVAWALAAVSGRGPFPPLNLIGVQGSGKTTLALMMRRLVDPNVAPLRSPPRNEHDLVIAAKNGWVIACDNLSYLPPWLSDALCRLSTGGGLGTRRLFTDDEEQRFQVRCPVILTSINVLATRSDLLDRQLLVEAVPIPDHRRQSEEALLAAFDAAGPSILGALLDGVAGALQNGAACPPGGCPRMADFAGFVTAAELALGWPRGSFMTAYGKSRRAGHEAALEASLLTVPLQAMVRVRCLFNLDPWEGTATELLEVLKVYVRDLGVLRQRGWPQNARWLSSRLRELKADLGASGIGVAFSQRSGPRSDKIITITALTGGPSC